MFGCEDPTTWPDVALMALLVGMFLGVLWAALWAATR